MEAGMCRAVIASVLVALCAWQAGASPVLARSAGMASEDRWNSRHIDGLPAEIRRGAAAHAAACGRPLAAEHAFALY